jgi:hypothetical protein
MHGFARLEPTAENPSLRPCRPRANLSFGLRRLTQRSSNGWRSTWCSTRTRGANRLSPPDEGADMLVLALEGQPTRVWQAKRFTGRPHWAQCETSLADAMARNANRASSTTSPRRTSKLAGLGLSRFPLRAAKPSGIPRKLAETRVGSERLRFGGFAGLLPFSTGTAVSPPERKVAGSNPAGRINHHHN